MARAPGRLWLNLILAARPHQAIKNLLLFFPLVFSHSLLQTGSVWIEFQAFCAFCLISSGIYLWNDLCDMEADRQHPTKRFRPLASGAISKAMAIGWMVLLLTSGVLAGMGVNPAFELVLGVYLALNIGYSLGLKNVVILDAMIVAFGFVLRAVAGSVAIGVAATHWLVLCTFMAALMLSFGKRYNELAILKDSELSHRQTLSQYSSQLLETLVCLCATASVISYALYTTAGDTVARFGSRNMLLTMPFVLFGVFRYLHLMYRKEAGDPARLFWRDRPMILSALAFVLTASLVIYGPLTVDLF